MEYRRNDRTASVTSAEAKKKNQRIHSGSMETETNRDVMLQVGWDIPSKNLWQEEADLRNEGNHQKCDDHTEIERKRCLYNPLHGDLSNS